MKWGTVWSSILISVKIPKGQSWTHFFHLVNLKDLDLIFYNSCAILDRDHIKLHLKAPIDAKVDSWSLECVSTFSTQTTNSSLMPFMKKWIDSQLWIAHQILKNNNLLDGSKLNNSTNC